MTALRKIRFEEAAAPVAAAPKLTIVTKAEAAPAPAGLLKNIALFFAAPFLGLAYIIALPVVGLSVLAVLLARAACKVAAVRTLGLVLKHSGMVVAAPFIGLAYVVFFPVICLALLAWTGGRALAGTSLR